MSTRGAYGFYINGSEKVTYNHSDSYPTYLGAEIIKNIQEAPDELLLKVAGKIYLIIEGAHPTPEQIEKYKQFYNADVSTGKPNSWYDLLHEAQGDLSAYIKKGLNIMEDSREFLKDSLSCEWAYIINMDNKTLELYKGRNKDPHWAGRYAKFPSGDSHNEYFGVALKRTITLDEVRQIKNIDEWCKEFQETCKKESEE